MRQHGPRARQLTDAASAGAERRQALWLQAEGCLGGQTAKRFLARLRWPSRMFILALEVDSPFSHAAVHDTDLR